MIKVTVPLSSTRTMLFLSHANPEDNEFTLWLALQLAAHGYPVWCDLTKLLGGERFWSDIESAIRERSTKFLFVLSRASNQKPGPLDELGVAFTTQKSTGISDFVIPLWIDDLKPHEFNVRLNQINAVDFKSSWAGGLARLLKKLAEDGVPQDERFGPAAVEAWWTRHMNEPRTIIDRAESLATNVYPIDSAVLYTYRGLSGTELSKLPAEVPSDVTKSLLASFAPPEHVLQHSAVELHEVVSLSTGFESAPTGWHSGDLRRVVTALLNQHWLQFAHGTGHRTFTFSGGQPAIYFTLADVGLERVTYPPSLGGGGWRQLMGFKTVASPSDGTGGRRYWHFALEARANTDFGVGYVFRPHVLFSDNGHDVWTDDARQHRARRSQCKGWWNDKWRDMIFAAVTAIRGDQATLDVSGSSGATLSLSLSPFMIEAPISYDEPESPSSGEVDDPDQDFAEDDEEEWI